MNKPHFDFRGNYEKYLHLPGVPPLPYFDQSVAYEDKTKQGKTRQGKTRQKQTFLKLLWPLWCLPC